MKLTKEDVSVARACVIVWFRNAIELASSMRGEDFGTVAADSMKIHASISAKLNNAVKSRLDHCEIDEQETQLLLAACIQRASHLQKVSEVFGYDVSKKMESIEKLTRNIKGVS